MADSNPLFTSFTKDGKQELFADPQHFTGANNEGRARSGEKDPFPTADYGMTTGGVWVPKKVADDGTTLTQLTGSIVEYVRSQNDITYLNSNNSGFFAENITQSTQAVIPIYVGDFKDRAIFIKNSHDAEVIFRGIKVYENSDGGHMTDYTIGLNEITVPAGASKIITANELPQLNYVFKYIAFYLQAPNATAGSFNYKVIGGR